ncbi:MAG: twin-arginine translocase subunit TatC [Candidatus Eisenbacteria bacterium]|nr:twin-arginine translocase subunit TatC [Candidatus Eisenbacteria bacterium]
MSFLDHLEELRRAVLHSVIVLVVAGAVAWPASGWLQEFVITHVSGRVDNMVFMAGKPLGPLSARLKVTLAAALLMAAPLILFRLWMFVAPGLKTTERRYAVPVIATSVLLFHAGFLLSFFIMGPQVPEILLGFGTKSVQNFLAIDDVMSLVLSLSVACGIVGEVPLVLTFLAWIGIISPESLVRQWRLAVVLILIAAAVVTPGDYGITMLLIALPIAGLYVISIFLAYLVTRKRRAARAS